MSDLCRKHYKGKEVEAETSALSWSLVSLSYCQRGFRKKKNCFKNVVLQSCRSVLFLEPFLDTCVNRTTFGGSHRAAKAGKCALLCRVISAPSHSLLFSMALWSFHIFHSKLVPVHPVPVGTCLLKKYFANNILAALNFPPQSFSSFFLDVTLIALNPTVESC